MFLKTILGICLVIASIPLVTSQNKIKTDSLEQVFLTERLSIDDQMNILAHLAKDSPDINKCLLYSEKLIALAKSVDSVYFIEEGYMQKGNALTRKGDLSLALESYLEAIRLAKSNNDINSLGAYYIAIADVYSVMDNKENTIFYYKKAIEVLENLPDKKKIYASALENLGDEYNLNFAKPDSALYYFEKSGKIFKEIDYKLGLAYNLGNKGLAYAQLQQTTLAEENIAEAIEVLTVLGDYYAISVYLTYMSDIYLKKEDFEKATSYAQDALEIAKKYGLKDQISDAYLKLSQIEENRNQTESALRYYKQHIQYRDSVKSISIAQDIAKLRRESEVKEKQTELNLLGEKEQKQRAIAIATGIGLLLIAILALGLYRRTIYISKTKKVIENERNKSDQLLLNILPEKTANELKTFGKVEAKKFDSASVLFSDFKGFTSYSETMLPEVLVESIGFYFSEFDRIIEKYGLEKIKTIGDSYMCAAGLPFPSQDHAINITKAGLEMVAFIESVKLDDTIESANFDIRVGINSGPVVAGVIGTKKFAYDVWGNTVNIASRMESMGSINKVNISEYTYDLIQNDFNCIYRGEFEDKNKGILKMYYVGS